MSHTDGLHRIPTACVSRRVLAKHRINLQLAKVMTLGERVEDNFLIDSAELQHNRLAD